MNNYVRSFEPIGDKGATVLILGTMPSKKSLSEGEYYANRQNVFWRLMGELFGAVPDMEYGHRQSILAAKGVAIWDVVRKCRRRGSSDSNIENESIIFNDFNLFFHRSPEIRNVFFNGANAEKYYEKNIRPNLAEKHNLIRYEILPSTSPANAHMNFREKLKRWLAVKAAADSASLQSGIAASTNLERIGIIKAEQVIPPRPQS